MERLQTRSPCQRQRIHAKVERLSIDIAGRETCSTNGSIKRGRGLIHQESDDIIRHTRPLLVGHYKFIRNHKKVGGQQGMLTARRGALRQTNTAKVFRETFSKHPNLHSTNQQYCGRACRTVFISDKNNRWRGGVTNNHVIMTLFDSQQYECGKVSRRRTRSWKTS